MNDGWICAMEHLPTAEDADDWGCVLVWHRYQGPMITGWRQVQNNGHMTHWQRTPAAPENYRDIHRERP